MNLNVSQKSIYSHVLRGYCFQKLLLFYFFSCINKNDFFIKKKKKAFGFIVV